MYPNTLSGIIPHIDSNISYLFLPKTWSRAGEHYYLNIMQSLIQQIKSSKPKGQVFTNHQTIWNIITSAVETKIAVLSEN